MPRPIFRRAMLVASLALAGGGCGDDAAEPGITLASTAPAPQSEPTLLDKTLVVAVRQLPRRLDPLGEVEAWGERVIDDLLFEGLVRRDPGGPPWVSPALADHCETDDPDAVRRIVCHVPDGTVFHDGTPLTMDDVVYSLRYWLDPRRAASRNHHSLHNMRSVEIVDGPLGAPASERDPGRWVRVEFEGRDPLALERLAEIRIVPRALHRGRADKFALEPVGTGPMRLLHWSEDRIVFERIEGWARGARVETPVERLVLREINDGAEALTAMRRGDVQVLDALADLHVPVELGRPGMAARFRAWVASPARYDVLVFNARPDSDITGNLRHALVAAVPAVGLAREQFQRPGHPLDSPVDPGDPVELDLWQIQDVGDDDDVVHIPTRSPMLDDAVGHAEAADILDRLGYPLDRGIRQRNDHNLRVTLTWDGARGPGQALADTLRASWRQLGLQTPEAIASWAYLMGLMRRGEFDVALARLSTHQDEDLYPWFHTRGKLNVSGLSDPVLDRALVAYRTAAGPRDRRAAQDAVAQRLGALEVAHVLHAPAPVLLASRRVTAMTFVDDLPRLDTLELTRRGSAEVWTRDP